MLGGVFGIGHYGICLVVRYRILQYLIVAAAIWYQCS
jgi:hypothetical protein